MSRRAIAHVRQFLADGATPVGVYGRLRDLSPVRFLFESVTGGEHVSRFSFLGAGPSELYRLYPDRLEREVGGVRAALPGPPLDALRRVLDSVTTPIGELPLTGGFVGFLGYDVVRLIERLPHRPSDPFDLPLAVLGRFDTVVVFDHAYQRVYAVSNEIEGEISAAEAHRELDRLAAFLTSSAPGGVLALPSERLLPPVAEPSLDGAAYRALVERAKEHIRAGDIFQVVLARRFKVARRYEPLKLYRALRGINPSPYMVLFECPDVALAGASPEMLVRKTGDRLETRPIAGTRPRSSDPEADRKLAEELLADPKENAEHVMLVDLGRNDLGRVCAPGTVRVASFAQIERYSHVMHLVSSVEGRIAPGKTALDALLACFPAGTLSGAPKVRAMEIIDDFEPEARGPYGGAVGYFSFAGDLDACITIRTLVVRGDETSVTAGAGIVADSDSAAEERETAAKAAATLAAVGLAERLEGRP